MPKNKLLIVIMVAALPLAFVSAAESPRKPNVIFVLADQWRAQALGCAGDGNARTPNLDRLAAHGVMLTTAVSTCPVCSPYRGSLMTGQYPLTHGVFLNDVCLRPKGPTLAEAFRNAGYQTAYIGKWHLDGHGRSAFVPPQRRLGFEFWRACECTHDYNRSLFYGDTDEKLYWQGYDAEDQTRAAIQYVRQHHQAGPFLLVLAWGPPHNPYTTAPDSFRRQFAPQSLKLRDNVPPEAAAAARRDLAGYYAHAAALDACIGKLANDLEQLGLNDDTLLVFTSDHGDMLGSHAQVRKQRPWDESIRVPFIAHWPRGLGSEGRRLSAPLGSPDIYPTLLGLCGISIPEMVEGEDRSAWLQGRDKDSDRAALIACYTPFGEWTTAAGGREYRGLRTSRYTYVRGLDGPWLLFDNQSDPFQQSNLAENTQYAALQAELDAALARELHRRHDEFLPGKQYLRRWGYKTDATGTVPYGP